MYYIVNQDKQIIAADADFLSLLNMDSLQELFVQVASEKISFEETGIHTLEINTGSNTLALNKSSYLLTTLVGDLLLNEVSEPEEAKKETKEEGSPITGFDTLPDEEIITLIETGEEPKEEPEKETIGGEAVEDIIGLVEPEEEEEKTVEEIIKLSEPAEEEKATEDLIELVESEEEKEEEEEQINLLGNEAREEEYKVLVDEEDTVNLLPDIEPEHLKPQENITVDTESISKILGISEEDYIAFLNEFIDKAVEEEDVVRKIGSPEHQKAITSLHKLSQMLHLTVLSDILDKAIAQIDENKIEEFYQLLSNLTFLAKENKSVSETKEAKEEIYNNEICQLNLNEVKPIHFDFQPQQASEDLGLPLELIIEFTHDFIAQAHEEEETFYNACKKGDIDTIHRTAHKLKGVASNLRIVPLAETLEELQFSEDTSRFEPLLKKYWGQFLTLENLMDTISNQKGGK